VDRRVADIEVLDVLGPTLNEIPQSSAVLGRFEERVLEPEAAFLGKPFSPASLASKVRQVLDQDDR